MKRLFPLLAVLIVPSAHAETPIRKTKPRPPIQVPSEDKLNMLIAAAEAKLHTPPPEDSRPQLSETASGRQIQPQKTRPKAPPAALPPKTAAKSAPAEPPRALPHVPTKSQFVERELAGLVRDALAVFYHECGFYPDTLDKLFQPTEQQPSCLHGTKQAPLANTPQNRDTIERLTYMPYGYDDFEISLKMYWTRD